MKRTFRYCDYCGKKITYKKDLNSISTIWGIVRFFFSYQELTYIEGDGCTDCFKSFQKWVKSRKRNDSGSDKKNARLSGDKE